MKSEAHPRKVEGLEINEADDGLVVYDPVHDTVNHLNASASIIFELCNGTRDVDAIAALMAEAYDLPSSPSDETLKGLMILTERRLIHWNSPTDGRKRKRSRRFRQA